MSYRFSRTSNSIGNQIATSIGGIVCGAAIFFSNSAPPFFQIVLFSIIIGSGFVLVRGSWMVFKPFEWELIVSSEQLSWGNSRKPGSMAVIAAKEIKVVIARDVEGMWYLVVQLHDKAQVSIPYRGIWGYIPAEDIVKALQACLPRVEVVKEPN